MRGRNRLCCLLFVVLASPAFTAKPAAAQPQAALFIKTFGVKRVQDCGRPVSTLSVELRTLHFPAGWTIAIACTPVAWNESLRLAEYPPTNSAFTSLRARITVLNAVIFARLRSEYRRSIAHELAHILCNCANEVRVEEIARRLEREASVEAGRADAGKLRLQK